MMIKLYQLKINHMNKLKVTQIGYYRITSLILRTFMIIIKLIDYL